MGFSFMRCLTVKYSYSPVFLMQVIGIHFPNGILQFRRETFVAEAPGAADTCSIVGFRIGIYCCNGAADLRD